MTGNELLQHLRHDLLRDGHQPYLWSDDLLLMLLNEAEIIFARKTHCLMTDCSSFAFVVTVPGQARYALSKDVIYVQEIIREDGNPVRNRSRSKMIGRMATGKPSTFSLDAGANAIKLHPTPDDEYELNMLVAHKPTRKITASSTSPEIPEEYHSALAQYACAKALTNNAPEGSDTVSAEPFMVAWEMALREAKRDAYHLRQGPSPTVINDWTSGRR